MVVSVFKESSSFILRVKLCKKSGCIGGYNIPCYIGVGDRTGEGIHGVVICDG